MELPITEIQLFQILKQRLGDKETEALVSFVDAKSKKANDRSLQVLATKQDLAETKVEIMRWMFGVFAMLMLAIIGLYFKH